MHVIWKYWWWFLYGARAHRARTFFSPSFSLSCFIRQLLRCKWSCVSFFAIPFFQRSKKKEQRIDHFVIFLHMPHRSITIIPDHKCIIQRNTRDCKVIVKCIWMSVQRVNEETIRCTTYLPRDARASGERNVRQKDKKKTSPCKLAFFLRNPRAI